MYRNLQLIFSVNVYYQLQVLSMQLQIGMPANLAHVLIHGTIIRTGITCKKIPCLYARLSLQVVHC